VDGKFLGEDLKPGCPNAHLESHTLDQNIWYDLMEKFIIGNKATQVREGHSMSYRN